MAEKNSSDGEWIKDCLIDFFRGPIWTMPLMNFIESRSIIFDSGAGASGEYRTVFEDFGRLVTFMLTSFREDVEITETQLEKAHRDLALSFPVSRNAARGGSSAIAVVAALEQIRASEDFRLFCQMMTRINVELQLQTIKMLRLQWGFSYQLAGEGDQMSEYEKKVLEEVMKKSLQEHLEEEQEYEAEVLELRRALTVSEQDIHHREQQNKAETELIESALHLSLANEEAQDKSREHETNDEYISTSNQGDNETIRSEGDLIKNTSSERQIIKDTSSEKDLLREISREDMSQRQIYLRQQRDRLMALKRHQRQEMLENDHKDLKQKRPKSSRAARDVVRGALDAKTLEIRRQTAETLRREVVDKNDD